jgi:Uma2 family endonuclease
MSLASPPPAPFRPSVRFATAADWLRALGDVPPERIVFDPLPGTATEADLLRLVEREDRLCELIDGTLVEKSVGYWESQIVMKLAFKLGPYIEAHDLGVITGEAGTLRMSWSGRVRLPDLAFVAKARVPTTYEAIPTLSPDLAVEVLSPGNTPAEMAQKLREYFGSGTRLAWYVDPRTRTVAVHHGPGEPTRVLAEADALDGEQVVPGFAMPVADLFRGVPAMGP